MLRFKLCDFLATFKKKYHELRKAAGKFDQAILPIVLRSKTLSSLYYCLISRQFKREHYAVLSGRLKYYQNLKSDLGNVYLLRRNTHRIEKGLIMRPRRDVFALDYIQETVNAYSDSIKRKEKTNSDDLKWTYDVLVEYFNVVSAHPIIDSARRLFLESNSFSSGEPFIPYVRDLNKPIPVSYEQFLAICYRRRSVRWYQQKPVPRELLDKAVSAAALSPSACNRQPFVFRIFDDVALVQKVASIPGGTQGFYHNFPVIIAVIGELCAYFDERDRHVIYIDGALASMSFMYALETLGLSTCAINWPDIERQDKEMSSILALSPSERVIMLIATGYPDPDALVPYSKKKSLEEIRRYN